jgi:pyruvate formate lyase activating enzyme
MTGLVFDIKRFAIHDGPGIRLAFHMKGCPLSCWWCHNPEGIRDPACAPGPNERRLSIPELMVEVEKERIFLDESGGGVTFSGGEPTVQSDFLRAALAELRRVDVHTAIDTCGYAPPDTFASLDPDLFLYDLKLIDSAAHLRFTGVPNDVILTNLRGLLARSVPVVIRIPVIPTITDTESNLSGIMEFLLRNADHPPISLLPYHQAAKAKYRRLRMENRVEGVEPPTPERMRELQSLFVREGFDTHIGG